MTVIPNPIAGEFRRVRTEDVRAVREACGIGVEGEYLLHVGKDNWYKNRPGVLRIVKELRKFARFSNVKLVMAGAALPDALRAEASEMGGVVECTGPSDARLRALYSGALALLFPSLEEGFGWPIVEAQACGCPVITSARAPMDEVAGRAAILIDPEDAAAAAAMIAARMDEAEGLVAAGYENIRRYSVEAAMNRYCELYRELISAPAHRSGSEARV
jgi:glycosyltransferase involved in cell wall biosynthesis